MQIRLLSTILLLLVNCTPANARPIDPWPYDKLLFASDLVFIGSVISLNENFHAEKSASPTVEASIKVHVVLKGNPVKKEVPLHYRRLETVREYRERTGKDNVLLGSQNDDDSIPVINGPLIIDFKRLAHPNNPDAKLDETAQFLFFVRKQDDHYIPASGTSDSAFSVFNLSPKNTFEE